MTSTYVYDSSQARTPVVTELRNVWRYRGLIRLLVARDLKVRYKRSVLGVWWTLLNPLLTTAVMWVVFSEFFRFRIPGDVPFTVYLLSGLLIVGFFGQAVQATGSSVVSSSSVLSKVYVPPEVFAFSASLAAVVNFGISLGLLIAIQIGVGLGVPWTILLIPIPAICLLMLVAGVGLLVAAAAVFFFDVLQLIGVLIQILTYMTPTFYPVTIVPDRFLPIVYANPLYSYLVVFRAWMYEASWPPTWNLVVMFVTAIGFFILGTYVFSRSWRRLVVLL